jgi:hypothetical protein
MSRRLLLPLLLLLVAVGGCYTVQRSSSYYGLATGADALVFVVDISGSMEGRQEGTLTDQVRGEAAERAGAAVARGIGGAVGRVAGRQVRRESTKLGGAKRELIPALRGLPATAQFGLLTFGQRVNAWRPDLVPASAGNTNAAALHVNGLSADGSTPMRAALERAFAMRGVRTIILVTDGQPSDGSASSIREMVRSMNRGRGVTLHTVGLGGDQDATFLAALAADNGGRYVRRP